jgi:hypothetical protein
VAAIIEGRKKPETTCRAHKDSAALAHLTDLGEEALPHVRFQFTYVTEGVTIDSIQVAEFESHTAHKEWLSNTAPAFLPATQQVTVSCLIRLNLSAECNITPGQWRAGIGGRYSVEPCRVPA